MARLNWLKPLLWPSVTNSPLQFSAPQVRESGPVRVTVVGRCTVQNLVIEAELSFFAGMGVCQCRLIVTNEDAAKHPKGIWTLGSDGARYIEDLSLKLKVIGMGSVQSHLMNAEDHSVFSNATIELYQDSSGGDKWDSPVHVNRDGLVMTRQRGFTIIGGDTEQSGCRATPLLVASRGCAKIALADPLFWQNFPKLVSTSNDGVVRYSFFPREFADVHEIQGGERKAHDIWLAFGSDAAESIAWFSQKSLYGLSSEQYAASNAVHYLTPRSEADHSDYLALLDLAHDAEVGVVAKREAVDEYGWRNYGEQWADHESKFHNNSDEIFVSHYNNQYDGIFGYLINYLRTTDARWFEYGHALARHVADIDVYHTCRDRAAYNYGLFWHTAHYVQAETASHRTFPASLGAGGGPSPEHLYTKGLLLHYFLTGDELSKEVVDKLAQFVIDADDGAQTILRFLDRGPTGNASWSGTEFYHGPGRGCGNGIGALLAGLRGQISDSISTKLKN